MRWKWLVESVLRQTIIAIAVAATLLLVSDATIAAQRFGHDFPESGLFIMATYFVGQWLIASSVGRSGVSHHPHSLPDPTPIVEFVL
jgi:hypothetical protein